MYRWFAVLFLFFWSPTAHAAVDETMCDRAAAAAAHGSDVPVDLLRALTRTETGRAKGGRLTPWPWTVNMEGAGHWFATRAEALEFVKKHHKRGAKSFDVGCFQINYRWHGEAFASIAAMFDPLQNAKYAARFLTELRGDQRSWREAVGRYHSKTPKFAQKYKARFDRILANLGPSKRLDAPLPRAPEPAVVVASSTESGEARGLARLAFLAPPSGAALITIEDAAPGAQNISLLRQGAPGGLFPAAKPLFN